MQIFDISWPIEPTMTAYKDKKTVMFEHQKDFLVDNVRESALRLGSHTGTHIDAPAHFMQQGKTIERLPLSATVGPCKVIDMSHLTEYIGSDDIALHTINEGDIILFKTTNSTLDINQPFNRNFIYLAASGAAYLADKKIKAVGIDYLGIERDQTDHATHKILFTHNITIIEGLRLQYINEGHYILFCLPLAIQGLEAAPARAVLMHHQPHPFI